MLGPGGQKARRQPAWVSGLVDSGCRKITQVVVAVGVGVVCVGVGVGVGVGFGVAVAVVVVVVVNVGGPVLPAGM